MSNTSLISNIENSLASVRSGKGEVETLAKVVRESGRALEGMPYSLAREVTSLADALDLCAYQRKEGFVPNLESALSNLETWLRQLPRRVA